MECVVKRGFFGTEWRDYTSFFVGDFCFVGILFSVMGLRVLYHGSLDGAVDIRIDYLLRDGVLVGRGYIYAGPSGPGAKDRGLQRDTWVGSSTFYIGVFC